MDLLISVDPENLDIDEEHGNFKVQIRDALIMREVMDLGRFEELDQRHGIERSSEIALLKPITMDAIDAELTRLADLLGDESYESS